MALYSCFCSISCHISKENAEKVVNPPNIPVIRKRETSDFLEQNTNATPITKHPKIFTTKVSVGDILEKLLVIKRYSKNLKIPPMALPKPTYITDFSILKRLKKLIF